MSRWIRLTIRRAGFRLRELVHPYERKDGVLFIGYTNVVFGLGADFRGLITALCDGSRQVALFPFSNYARVRPGRSFMPERVEEHSIYPVNVIGSTMFHAPRHFVSLDPARFRHSYTIHRTFWELERVPDELARNFKGFDELWVPNGFVADACRHVFKGPIAIVPPLIEPDAEEQYDGVAPDVAKAGFRFLFSFDFYSGVARKNPVAVAEAFMRAFPADRSDVELVIKSMGKMDTARPEDREVVDTCARDERITLVNETYTREQYAALMHSCDCYVSLHRAEGVGLGMVEAMLLSKPVIATDYSGSRDFLNEQTGFPVRYTLRPIRDGEFLNGEGQSWAEADVDHAAEMMRRVVDDPQTTSKRAAAGRDFVLKHYSRQAVRRAMEERLEAIGH